MDYLNGLPKWTTPGNHLKGEKQLFEARHIIFLTIPHAFASETFHRCNPLVLLHTLGAILEMTASVDLQILRNVSEAEAKCMVRKIMRRASNGCFSPFKWFSGVWVIHLGSPWTGGPSFMLSRHAGVIGNVYPLEICTPGTYFLVNTYPWGTNFLVNLCSPSEIRTPSSSLSKVDFARFFHSLFVLTVFHRKRVGMANFSGFWATWKIATNLSLGAGLQSDPFN